MKDILNHLTTGRLVALGISLVLLLAAFVLKFCLPGYSFSALVCLILMGVILFYSFFPLLGGRFPGVTKAVLWLATAVLIVGFLVVAITEGFILHAAFQKPQRVPEYVIVLGAKVREDGPSASLMDRIHAAYDYLTAHPEVTAIVSGGQGKDEPITEAQAMYQELVAMGIDPQQIWMENKATSTWGNLQFSLDLIEDKTGTRPTELGILSSEYHLFRASLFTKACGVDFIGIPARTSRPGQAINHFMREVAGVWHYILLGGLYD